MRVLLFVLLITTAGFANDNWNRIIDLRGTWKFEIGDNMNWKQPDFDDSQWQEIFVPANWEDEGFPGYDGFAWYRKKFSIPEKYRNKALYLNLGNIDDADEVYVNGQLVGFFGGFPPEYATAYHVERTYHLPSGLLKFGQQNVIAVRVFDNEISGGIVKGRIGLYEMTNYLYPQINLQGKWKLMLGDNLDGKAPDFNDEHWKSVWVPAFWETQGFKNYDGFGWYRVKFSVPERYRKEKLILMLGKVDDLDETYLNGKRIGRTGKIYDDPHRMHWSEEYQQYRAYYMPAEIINFGGENVLAVRVFDAMVHGGIYNGPVGIVLQKDYLDWKKKIDTEKQNWLDFFLGK